MRSADPWHATTRACLSLNSFAKHYPSFFMTQPFEETSATQPYSTQEKKSRNRLARNVDGNSKVGLPDLTILSLCHGQPHVMPGFVTIHITFDVTNNRAESTLNSSPDCFCSWFVTLHITSDVTSEKGGSPTQHRILQFNITKNVK